MIESILIIGYGKFGKVVESILKKSTSKGILLFDPHLQEHSSGLEEKITNSELIILAPPLDFFEDSVISIKPYLTEKHTVMEVCSTNIYPKEILLKHISKQVNLIGSHPMFGPQTLKFNNHDYSDLNFVIDNIQCSNNTYEYITDFLRSIKFNVIEMSADEHDKKSAKFHFLAQLVGNSLEPLCLEESNIDTVSYEFLFNFMKRLDPDIKLLKMMYLYNPYSKKYLTEFQNSFSDIYSQLEK